jgi:hypothetical protein
MSTAASILAVVWLASLVACAQAALPDFTCFEDAAVVSTTYSVASDANNVVSGDRLYPPTASDGVKTCFDTLKNTDWTGRGNTRQEIANWTQAGFDEFLSPANRGDPGTYEQYFYKLRSPPEGWNPWNNLVLRGGPTDYIVFVIEENLFQVWGETKIMMQGGIVLEGGIPASHLIWIFVPNQPDEPMGFSFAYGGTFPGYYFAPNIETDTVTVNGMLVATGLVDLIQESTIVSIQGLPTVTDCSGYSEGGCNLQDPYCRWSVFEEQCLLNTAVPCYAAHGTNATACNADVNCHMESRGPYAICTDGLAVSYAQLNQELSYEVLSYELTAISTMELKVRVPIFQAFDAIGHWSFLLGSKSNFDGSALYTTAASNVCNTLVSNVTGAYPIESHDWPATYASVTATCGLANDAAVLAEMERLQTWVQTHHVAPWVTLNGGSTVFSGNADCWRLIFGELNTPPTLPAASSTLMEHGLVTRWDMPLNNFIDWTLHINMDYAYQTCRGYEGHPGATGFLYQTSTSPESIRYTVPVTILQRNSVQQRWSSNVYLSLTETTTQSVQVSTTIVTTVDYGNVRVSIVSITPIQSGTPDALSLTSAHSLRMVFLVRIPLPANTDVNELGPVDNADVTIPANCYGDTFVGAPTSFSKVACTTSGTRECTYLVTIETEARTDLADGSSFARCDATGATTSALDRMHIFNIYPKMCTTSSGACYQVSTTPIRVASSFNYPVYPVSTLSQNIDLFALVLPAANSDIPTYVDDPSLLPATSYISADSTLTVAVFTRRELWTRYTLSILPGPTSLVLESAPLGTAIDHATAWAGTSLEQPAIKDGMVHVPRWIAAENGETRVQAAACATAQEATSADDAQAGYGCDSFTLDGAWLFGQQVGPQIRFTIEANVDKSTFQPQSRRLLSFQEPQSMGSWSKPRRRLQSIKTGVVSTARSAAPAPTASGDAMQGNAAVMVVLQSRHAMQVNETGACADQGQIDQLSREVNDQSLFQWLYLLPVAFVLLCELAIYMYLGHPCAHGPSAQIVAAPTGSIGKMDAVKKQAALEKERLVPAAQTHSSVPPTNATTPKPPRVFGAPPSWSQNPFSNRNR